MHGANRPLERVRYFSGQLLDAQDLQAEQDYLIGRMRRQNRLLHGWGVVAGLHVTPKPSMTSPWQVAISPGFALSPQGDEILVPEELIFDPGVQPPDCGHAFLSIRCFEREARLVPVPTPEGSGVEPTRIEESFELTLLSQLPSSHREARAADEAWAAAARAALATPGAPLPTPPLPAGAAEPWVVLATRRPTLAPKIYLPPA